MNDEQQFCDDVRDLVRAGCRALKKLPYRSPEYDALSEAIANVEVWGENDDPRQNGWVDSKGRP